MPIGPGSNPSRGSPGSEGGRVISDTNYVVVNGKRTPVRKFDSTGYEQTGMDTMGQSIWKTSAPVKATGNQSSTPKPGGSSSAGSSSGPFGASTAAGTSSPFGTGQGPAQHKVDKSELVRHRLRTDLDPDSPLMQQAARTGYQFGNSRGLLNSSISAGAAQAAMVDRALEISGTDANTKFSNSINNVNAQNQFRLTELEGSIRKQLAEISGAYQLAGIDKQVAGNLQAQNQEHLFSIGTNPDFSPEQQQHGLSFIGNGYSASRASIYL